MSEYKKKYPWLKIYDPYPEEGESDDFDPSMWIPEGWVKTLWEPMCEDLDREIKAANLQDEFRILELKEKYSEMRIFCHPSTPAIDDITRTYEALSSSICQYCGSIEGVKMTNFGWVISCCRNCFQKLNGNHNLDKFDALPTEELQNTLKWIRYSKNGNEHFEIDISETTQKIRERYAQRKANGEFKDNPFDEWEDDYYGA